MKNPYPFIPILCKCGCNETVWNGKEWINGHNLKRIVFTVERNKKISNSLIRWYDKHPQKKIEKSEKIKGNLNPTKRPEVREKMKGKRRPDMVGDLNPSRRPEVREKLSGENNHFYGKHHTKEIRKKLSQIRIENEYSKGKNNPNWQGGISYLPYCPKFNKELKIKVRERDNYQCQNPNCLTTQLESLLLSGKSLYIHHIHYDKENCAPDLITLCISCNTKANKNRDYWEQLYMKVLEERNLLGTAIK